MILYVVHGNTYYDGCGYIENIFGIYTEKYAAEAAKDLRIKELYEKEIARGQMSIVENVSESELLPTAVVPCIRFRPRSLRWMILAVSI